MQEVLPFLGVEAHVVLRRPAETLAESAEGPGVHIRGLHGPLSEAVMPPAQVVVPKERLYPVVLATWRSYGASLDYLLCYLCT